MVLSKISKIILVFVGIKVRTVSNNERNIIYHGVGSSGFGLYKFKITIMKITI